MDHHHHSTWLRDSPERTMADAFEAFRARDGGRLARLATRQSLLAFAESAVSVVRHTTDVPSSTTEPRHLTDKSAATILEQATAGIPKFATDSAECTIIGHVLETPDTAQVLFRLNFRMDDGRLISLPPEPQVATMRMEDGEWRLVLDEWAHAGMPGFRNTIWQNDPAQAGAVDAS